ncbi:molybdate ABC transporter, inner membrane subunit [Desulfatibacillum aliphaticivorans]|uniref:Molybdenum transport system permease n=1 Tax=Desulfatibacillum aliphaticivorans TaxID=218208 RepID=B8FGV3_DESAL|nr:molybdate ABC transporter permease subunit [Desulfatibacillum aliphaticivorans]ACL05333.1 molybdate ABC transporter, inner membrane subunit [Desulfatibacillum aliphaticivorans]
MNELWSISPAEWTAIKLSLKVSGWAVFGSLPPGIFLAWVLSRKQFPGKQVLDGIIHLPLVLPPVVTGYILLLALGRQGFIGKFLYEAFGFTVAFTWKGAVVASAVMAFPLLVRAVRLSVDSVDQGLEKAARTLGAGPLRVFITVSLPLMIPGIITGAILAFARSLGEFGATITFVSNIQGETQTLPLALYSLTQIPDGEMGALRLCIAAVILAMAALLVSEWMSGRFAEYIKG